jgi:hypothetical protein
MVCIRWVGHERKGLGACAHCDGVLRPLDVITVLPIRVEARTIVSRIFSTQGIVSALVVGLLAVAAGIPYPLLTFVFALGFDPVLGAIN